MSLTEIKNAIEALSPEERRDIAAWVNASCNVAAGNVLHSLAREAEERYDVTDDFISRIRALQEPPPPGNPTEDWLKLAGTFSAEYCDELQRIIDTESRVIDPRDWQVRY